MRAACTCVCVSTCASASRKEQFSRPSLKARQLLPPQLHPWQRMRTFYWCQRTQRDEGQGRKIRKSRVKCFSEGIAGRTRRFWVGKTAVGRHRRTITAGCRARKTRRLLGQMREERTGKWENDILAEFISPREHQCKRHYARTGDTAVSFFLFLLRDRYKNTCKIHYS